MEISDYEPVTLVPPTHDLLSPAPVRYSYTNRGPIVSPTSPEHPLPSPLSAASLTSLLNAAWPAVPPTILAAEPEDASNAMLRTDESANSFPPPGEEPRSRPRSSRISSLLSALTTDAPAYNSRHQAVDGGVRIAGGPSSARGPSINVTSRHEMVYDSVTLGKSIDSLGTIPPPYAQYSDTSTSGSPRSTRAERRGRSAELVSI